MKVLEFWNKLTQSQFWRWVELWFDDPNNRSFALEVVKTVVSLIGSVSAIVVGLGVFLNFYIATKNTKIAQDNAKIAQDNAKIAESRLLTERFSKAVEQLSHEKTIVRLGGIHTLDKIARDSPADYHWTVMEVLTSFLP